MASEGAPGVGATSDQDIAAAIKTVRDNSDAMVTWRYERDRPQLATLYERAVSSQWNANTDLDWDTEVDLDQVAVEMVGELVPPMVWACADVPGSPLANWGEKEFANLALELLRARMSQFMHAEQGAMLVAAKIVETVPWIDAKYFAATQTMDEARHTEVFARYVHTKLGEPYACNPNLQGQLTALLEESRWDMTYLGMQIVVESLALAAISSLQRVTTEPLLRKLLRYVMADEARHVAFGIVSLEEVYRSLSSAELLERQEFLLENSLRNRKRAFMPEVWQRLGVSVVRLAAAMKEVRTSDVGQDPYAREFQAKLVPNVRRLGLLDANDGWLRDRWDDLGLLTSELVDDTASDYLSV